MRNIENYLSIALFFVFLILSSSTASAAEKSLPTITWSNPADISSGIALSSTQLNAVATDPVTGNTIDGAFIYNPAAGTVLSEGTQTLHVVFTPYDYTAYYDTVKDVTINVTNQPNQPTPTITWSNPADILSGTALSSTQLNAVATDPVTGNTIDGAFVYTPAAGTVLSVGTQTLHVDFTPEDSANYTIVSKNITIIVVAQILPVANFTASATEGYAPLSVQFTDTSQYVTARSWDFNNDGAADSNDVSPVYTYDTAGNYTVNLTASNTNGTVSKNAIIAVLKKSSGGGSSSGGSSGSSHSSGGSSGGGAGGSPEPQSNVAAKEISQAFVSSGKSIKLDFPRNATPVVSISFDSKKTAGKTTTIVEMLKGKSTLVSGLPSNEVYKYLNIWVGNSEFATPNNIENPVICFKVEKSWIQDENITQSSITFHRYSDKKWNQLPTSLLSEDNKYLYFTAKTPGFSPFVITGNTVASATGTNIQPGLSTQNIERNNTKPEAGLKSEQEKNANLSVFGMICIIALLLVAFLFKIDKP